MLEVSVQETLNASPDEILGLVMDIERYAEVDDKIKPVLGARREGNRVEFACRPKLAGLRQPKVVQFLELTPGRRIDIGLLPKPHNRIAHAMARFEAASSASPCLAARGLHERSGSGSPQGAMADGTTVPGTAEA